MERAVLAALFLAVAGHLIGCGPSEDDTVVDSNSTPGSNETLGENSTPSPPNVPVPTPVPTPSPPAPELTDSQKAAMVAHLSEFSSKPEKVAAFYSESASAMKALMAEVSKGPSSNGRRLQVDRTEEIIAGVSVFGTQLFAGVEKLLPEDIKSVEYYSQFKTAWLDLFGNLAEKSAPIVSGIERYIDEGSAGILVDVIEEIMVKAKEIVQAFLPADVYGPIGKYLEGVVKMFTGFSAGWNLLEENFQVDGVVAIYDGLRDGLTLVLPDNMKKDETYLTVMGFLDEVVADLSENVAMFKKRLTENKACWRKKENRENQKAQICPSDDYYWDGIWQCLHDTKNSRPALCDESSDFKELLGETKDRRCYRDCDSGSQPMGGEETMCVTTCSGDRSVIGKYFLASWENMCGADSQVFIQIQTKLIAATTNLIFDTVNGIVEAVNTKKFIGSSMNKIINSVLKFAAEFVFPDCDAS
jgi:hypothetical protein